MLSSAFSSQDETIVAVSTPPGRGAIAVVRVSGPKSRDLVRALWAGPHALPPRKVVLANLVTPSGAPLDQCLVTWFPAPNSYTGEDLTEISCHGSPAITTRIVEALLVLGGRPAQPGEFTLRAFLNGKMDLAQAEAVRDLIESQTSFQARIAQEQLGGRLSRQLASWKEELVRILCYLETTLEFVEDEVPDVEREHLTESLETVLARVVGLVESFSLGRIVSEGLRVAVTGKPNVGKSSLFNSLVMDSRAIVTAQPGTTRDAVTETVSLSGLAVRLADTAGIREGTTDVENLGIEKSMEFIREADVVLLVVDGSKEFEEGDWRTWEAVREKKCLLVLNKEDLGCRCEVPREVLERCWRKLTVSALDGTGLQELRKGIVECAVPGGQIEEEGLIVTSLRHKMRLEAAAVEIHKAINALGRGLSEEFVAHHLRQALGQMGEITGETTVEDILGQIFSTFCIGK